MTIPLTLYLIKRLKELNIEHLFGVPGDYNLPFLEIIEHSKQLQWVGTCNEQNAAYASDSYARIRGMGALLTTYGVGELNALNGIAGAFAENIAVISIVGMPEFRLQKTDKALHHTLNQPDFLIFSKMAASISVAQCIINPETENPAAKIDHVLTACWQHKKPVYLGISQDMAQTEVLDIAQPLPLILPAAPVAVVNEVVEQVAGLINQAKRAVCLIDDCAVDSQFSQYILSLIEMTGLPFAIIGMGKGVFSESHPQYIGIYQGDFSMPPTIQTFIETADLALIFQPIYGDFGTGAYTAQFPKKMIEIFRDAIKTPEKNYVVFYHKFFLALLEKLKPFLPRLKSHYQQLETKPFSAFTSKITQDQDAINQLPDETLLTHAIFWQEVERCIGDDTIVLSETGSSAFGSRYLNLTENNSYILQSLWLSIGYSVGATLGATLADSKRRVLAFIGDGSFQVTAQELSTLLRLETNPVIFLLNNHGYTIERFFHGMHESYNDIADWHYTELPKVFKGKEFWVKQIKTLGELKRIPAEIDLHKGQLVLVEVLLPLDDAPLLLKNFVAKVKSRT